MAVARWLACRARATHRLLGSVAVAAGLLAAAPAAASPDSLDPTFSTDGIVTTQIGGVNAQDLGLAIARQSDGKLVVAGSSGGNGVFGSGGDFAVARYNTDGSLDATFDGDGKVTTSFASDQNQDDEAWAVAVGPDDKIVVAGVADNGSSSNNFAVARYNDDGSLDTSFDGDGKVTVDFVASDHAYAVTVQDDGKVVVAGTNGNLDWAVARLNTNGTLDTGFDGDGKVTTPLIGNGSEEVYDIEVQPDDKIVAAGSAAVDFDDADFAVVRYNDDGSLDTSFDGDGKVTTAISTSASNPSDVPRGLTLQDDGKLVAAGETFPFRFAVARYNDDGSLDTSFDGDGVATTNLSTSGGSASVGEDVAMTPDDKIVVAGRHDACVPECSFGIARYNSNGSLDTGFDADGKAVVDVSSGVTETDWARGLLVQPDGKVVAGGYADMGASSFDFDFAAVRLLVNGDETPPAVSLTDTDPDSPSNDNNPEIKGTAEAGATVKLYTTSDCSGSAAATGTGAAFASPGLTVSVPSNTTTTFRAVVTDAAGHSSGCSTSSITYVEDSSAPARPALTDTDPDSPANDTSPEVKGSAEVGSTVKLYTTNTCTAGSLAAEGTAADFASPGFTATVADNSSTTFYATATDVAGNTSLCSTSSITYIEDSIAPATPSITDSDPDSPSTDNSPEVKGTAEAGSTVKLYTSADCSGSPAATGTAASFASPGLTATVADNSSTSFHATATDVAGNTSACSSGFTYIEDSIAPAAPTITDTDPDSPSNDNFPKVKGTVGAGSPELVLVYKNSTCTGSSSASGTVPQFTGAGVEVSVSSNSTTALSARTRDLAGNESACSNTMDYVEDSVAPSAPTPTDTDPNSPANDNNPEVKGSAQAGSTVRVFTSSTCSDSPVATGSAADYASPGLTASVADDSSTTFKATATDAAGNTSACSAGSITYVEDSTAPAAPSITDTDPDSPSNDNNPEVKGTVGGGSPSQVRIYKSADCSGAQAASGAVATFTGSGISVAVTSDATTPLSASTADAAGNESSCSNTIDYVEDSTAPAAPSITDSDPDSPANENAPEIKGSAEAGSTVRLFKSGGCLGGVTAQGSATDFASPGLTVSVSNDTSTTLTATSTDAAGNISPCSGTFSYVEDSTAPTAPTVTDTDPDSPANDNSPEVKGSAAAGSTVNLYTTSDCTGSPAATGSAAGYSSPGLTASVADDSTSTFKATATDAAGNVSACSSGSVTFVEDSTAPAAPSVTDTDPDSPANDGSPEVKGTAAAGSTVKVYKTSDCSGSPAATGTAATFASPGLTASVPNDSTTTFRATATDSAGNASVCSSTSVAYVEDSTAPAAPAFTDTDPDSPANENSPEVKGTAEAGATVALYASSLCFGSVVAQGPAADFASPGFTVTVNDNTSTTYSAKATDAAGNTSGCSTSPITYVEDSAAPAAPSVTDTDPDSPANDNSPEVKGSAAAGSTVSLYTTSDCTGTVAATGSATSYSSPGLTVAVTDDSSTTFRATATDTAGNVSACSSTGVTYVEDSTGPAAPSIADTDPDSPANDNNPEVKGTTGAGSPTQVKVYKSSSCSGSPAATGTVAQFTGSGISVAVTSDATTPLSARTSDAAGNDSTCSGSFDYVEDSTAPAAPTLTDTDPDSPANENAPKVKGTAEAGSTVALYTNSTCTSAVAAQGSAAAFASPGLAVSVADNTTTTYRATATDAAGNSSACSTSTIDYAEDSAAPAAPSIADTDPDSPANDNNPEVKGTTGAGSPTQVKVYKSSSCSGSPAATGTVAQFTGTGITVSVDGDATAALTARTSDAAGNDSTCSGSFDYVEDSTAPAAPTLTDTDPDSPANENAPKVKGTAEAGSTVSVHTSADCNGTAAATGSSASFTSPGLTASVANDSTTTFRATATDAAGNVSDCSSSSIAYVEDSTPPGAPSITDSDPDSPADDTGPELKGTAQAGSTVKLYATSGCTGTPAATGTAAAFASPGLTVAVATDSTTTFRATATDAAGNASACSDPFTYVEDSTAPPAPSITDSDPDSPANDTGPELKGTAEAGSTVRLYTTSGCTGTPAATGTAAAFASPGLTVAVPDDSSTAFRATATDATGHTSACSSPFTYVEDSTPPAAPTLTDTDPNSPANDNNPEVKGTAEAGSTVTLYTTSDCTGTPAATGAASAFASPGLVAPVANDSTTTFRATATDTAGNVSGCSTSTIAYVEDSTAPAAPSLTDTDPDSPANDSSPNVKGTAEAGSTVSVHTSADCHGTAAATGSSANFTSPGLTTSVANDSTTTFRATATDAAGNVSPCSSSSIAYVEDSTPPAAPALSDSDPDSPANDNSPRIKGSAEAGSTVALYTSSICAGTAAGQGSAASFASPGIEVAVDDDSATTFQATATDAAGNTSGCSDSTVTYTEDSSPPETTIDSGPEGATTDQSPTFAFSASEGGSSFACQTDGGGFGGCSSPAGIGPLAPGPHTFEVRATDPAGNTDSTPASRAFTVTTTPVADSDGDGKPDAQDACPTVAATTASGCPEAGEPPGGEPPGATNGDDVLSGDALANVICGLLGDDEIDGGGGNDTLFGDLCNDTARTIGGAQAGTDGDDELDGGDGHDRLYGAGGKDVLRGGNGNDKLFGGGGKDVLSGAAGKDALDGGAGNDRLTGGADVNRYKGGAGNDVVSARNRRKETVDCGSGRKDVATVDKADKVRGCERVKRARR